MVPGIASWLDQRHVLRVGDIDDQEVARVLPITVLPPGVIPAE